MNYDNVLPYLSRGDFGKYQKKIYFLLCLPSILCAFHKLAGVFLLAVPDYRCKLDWETANATFELSADVLRASFPFLEDKQEYSKCEYYYSPGNVSKCSEYIWNTTKVESSAVKSFEMVCDRAPLRASADSLMMVGVMVGSYVFGDLSDRYGRRPSFMLCLLIQVVFGLFIAVSPEFFTYTIGRMVVGATTSGVVLISYVLSVEMVNKESRLYAGVIVMMFFSSGYIFMAGLAYFIHDWRLLQAALTIPGLLFLFYWWFIPESTRWLLAHDQKDKAIKQIQTVARANKLVVPQEILDKLESDKPDNKSKHSVLDLFKTPYLRFKSLLIFFMWFVTSGVYYGLSWSTNNLGGNPLINFMISGAVEFPASYFLILTLNRWGRKIILSGSMLVGGTVLLASLLIPEQFSWQIVALTMFAKMTLTASYGTIYIFSAEQFPTVIRNVALGAASMAARFGGIAAPFLLLLGDYWKPAPFFILGAFTLIGGLLSLFLPETHNRELPETIEDGERLGKTKVAKTPAELEALNPIKN